VGKSTEEKKSSTGKSKVNANYQERLRDGKPCRKIDANKHRTRRVFALFQLGTKKGKGETNFPQTTHGEKLGILVASWETGRVKTVCQGRNVHALP